MESSPDKTTNTKTTPLTVRLVHNKRPVAITVTPAELDAVSRVFSEPSEQIRAPLKASIASIARSVLDNSIESADIDSDMDMIAAGHICKTRGDWLGNDQRSQIGKAMDSWLAVEKSLDDTARVTFRLTERLVSSALPCKTIAELGFYINRTFAEMVSTDQEHAFIARFLSVLTRWASERGESDPRDWDSGEHAMDVRLEGVFKRAVWPAVQARGSGLVKRRLETIAGMLEATRF